MRTRFLGALIGVAMTSLTGAAQDNSGMTQVSAEIDSEAIALYDGPAPGSENATQSETWYDVGTERWVSNVTVPTLLPVLPKDPDRTRVAVIIVPGGGFQFVSMDNEGYPIANWLAERGIAAFILKYRVMQTPEGAEAFEAHMGRMFTPPRGEARIDVRPGIPLAIADAQTALALVRGGAEDWGYDADKIGMLGFSAGAIATLGVTRSDTPDAPKPDFIGYIYGPMGEVEVPADAPPMFAALAADDDLFAGQGFGLVEAWQSADIPVELHYYQSGGHGFGSYKRGVPADAWFDQFVGWLEAQGLLAPAETD